MSTADEMLIFAVVFVFIGWVLLVLVGAVVVLVFRGVRALVDAIWGPFAWWHPARGEPSGRSPGEVARAGGPVFEDGSPQDAAPSGYEDSPPDGSDTH
ncbi:hypothetical protein [Streptomyces tauricus]|uniref:hypothetical protein n=1 Tax=Streptomyces tauricus TaxID=68274 RepID=UPI0033E61C4B